MSDTRLEDYEALAEEYRRVRLEAAELRDWKKAHRCPPRIQAKFIIWVVLSVTLCALIFLFIGTLPPRSTKDAICSDHEIDAQTVLCWRVDELIHRKGENVKRAFHVVGVTDKRWENERDRPPVLIWDKAFYTRDEAWNFIKADGRSICGAGGMKK